MHRQEFDRRDTEVHEVADHCRVGQTEIGTPQRTRHAGMHGRVRTDVQFVDDGVLPRRARSPMLCRIDRGRTDRSRVEGGGRGDDRQWRVPERVGGGHRAEGIVVVREQSGRVRGVALQIGTRHSTAPRIEQDLVRIGAEAVAWTPRPVRAIAVSPAGADLGDRAVPDAECAVGQIDTVFATVIVDQAHLQSVAMGSVDGEAGTVLDRRRAEWERRPIGLGRVVGRGVHTSGGRHEGDPAVSRVRV